MFFASFLFHFQIGFDLWCNGGYRVDMLVAADWIDDFVGAISHEWVPVCIFCQ